MLISLRWLGRHVDLSGIAPADLARDLTLSTAEVEGLHAFAPHLADVKVGHVVTRERHPDADKLSLCTVDVGGPEPLQIVCGAPNVRAGLKVAVAEVGTRLPGDVKIKRSKIRGVDSCGMICSLRELELGDEHDGIWELPADLGVGRPVAEAADLADHVLEIDNKSLTHRPDLWGHRGIAREVAAIYRRELRPLDLTLPPNGSGTSFPVRIESPACSRYLALAIDGVRAEASPLWLRMLLLAIGERPHDLLVDLSNFVMFDLGQPNHLFDRRALSPEGIVVRMARPGERLTTLDGGVQQLGAEDLLICSGDEPVALAGVMGGLGSKVGADTSRLLLEVATFHPTTVRRTAARLACRTQASARFEKSLDPTLPLQAAAHLVRTLRALQPDVALPSPPTDVGAWKDPAHVQTLRPERVRRLLGAEIPDAEIADCLTRLGFGVRQAGAAPSAPWTVQVPSRRSTKDVTLEEDLVEEVGRLFRYANIPEAPLVGALLPPPRDERRELVRRAQDWLAGGARFHEVYSYSFVSHGLLERLGLLDQHYVEVVNPIAEGESRVRRGVLPSLIGRLEPNRRQRADVRLFEIGKGYLPEHANARGEPREVHELGLCWALPEPARDARFDQRAFLRLKGAFEDLLRGLGFGLPRWTPLCDVPEHELARPSWLHPGRALVATLAARALADGVAPADLPGSALGAMPDERVVGLLGELEPGLAKPLGLTAELASDVALASLSFDRLLECARASGGYRPIPRYPGVKVDVALAVPEPVPAAALIAAVERAGKGLVQGCQLFDLYQGERLGAGKKSLAFHVLLQSDERTLDEKDQHKFLERLVREAESLGGELRRE